MQKLGERIKSWQQDGIFIQGTVNISAQQLDTSIFKTIREALQKTQLEPKFLEIEIAETAMIN